MIWAIKNEQRVLAEPNNLEAVCSICKSEVIPKCGSIKVWHWSHKSNKECDWWSEEETIWHKNWKNNFPKECQEIILIGKECEKHRADIKINNLIIELQNSPLSSEDILKREDFYNKTVGNMIWLLNGKELCSGLCLKSKKDIFTFRWKHPAKTWWFANEKIYIDFNDLGIFLIKKIYKNIPCGGWGILLSRNEFLKNIKNGNI